MSQEEVWGRAAGLRGASVSASAALVPPVVTNTVPASICRLDVCRCLAARGTQVTCCMHVTPEA